MYVLDEAVYGRRGGGYGAVREDAKLLEYVAEMGRLNRRGCDGDINQAPDQFAPRDTRQESALREVVGGEGDDNIPTRKGTTRNESVV